MILNSTMISLQAVLAGAVAANQPEFCVDYVQWFTDGESAKPATYEGALNSNTDVSILPAPMTQGAVFEPLRVSIYNKDTASVTVTVKTDDGTNERILIKATLLTLETLNWERGEGWYAVDANGNRKTTVSSVNSSAIIGTTTNDNAAAGRLGEYVESVVGATNFPTSTQYGDLTSISLTAGDWDVSLNIEANANGATVVSWNAGISVTSGNSGTGLVQGSNLFTLPPPSTTYDTAVSVANWRRSLAATTTVYAKFYGNYSVATPQAYGRLSARRVR